MFSANNGTSRRLSSLISLTLISVGSLTAGSAAAATSDIDRLNARTSVTETTIRLGTAHRRIVPGFDNQGSVTQCKMEGYVWWRWEQRGSYLASLDGSCGYFPDTRNFFSFDLSAVRPGTVSRAVLVLRRFDTLAWPYASTDATLTYNLFGVHTGARTLARQSADPFAVFNDLGSGREYGGVTVRAAANPDDLLRIPMSLKAVKTINDSAGGWFTVGGALTGYTDDLVYALFGNSNSVGIQRLVLTSAQ